MKHPFVALSLTVSLGLPQIEHIPLRLAIPEPQCIPWVLPLWAYEKLNQVPLICCFEKPEDEKRTCRFPEKKW